MSLLDTYGSQQAAEPLRLSDERLGPQSNTAESEVEVDEQEPESLVFRMDQVGWGQSVSALIDPTRSGQVPKITHASTSNGFLLVGAERRLFRWDPQRSNSCQELTLPKRDADIYKVFLHPNSVHYIISLKNNSNYYGSFAETKMRELSTKSCVEAVAWDSKATPSASGVTLVATKDTVFEMSFDQGKERTCRRIWAFPSTHSIQALAFFRFPMSGPVPQWLVFISTSTPPLIYRLVGGPDFESIQLNVRQPDWDLTADADETVSSIPSELCFTYPSAGSHPTPNIIPNPNRLAFLAYKGIFLGALNYTTPSIRETVVYDLMKVKVESPGFLARSLALTQFHCLTISISELLIVNTISNEIIQHQSFPSAVNGSLKGLLPDPSRGIIWLYAERAVYKITCDHEVRDIWSVYLTQAKKGNPTYFDMALDYCNSEAQRSVVLQAKADYLFNKGEYRAAAELYSEVPGSFEDVVYKFYSVGCTNELTNYLNMRLRNLNEVEESERDNLQITLLATWLCQFYLNELDTILEGSDEFLTIQLELRNIFADFHKFLDKDTIYKMISSRGRDDEWRNFASQIGDCDRLMSFYIRNKDYKSAVHLLKTSEFTTAEVYFYKYASILFAEYPEKTVELWKKRAALRPVDLLPAFGGYFQGNHKSCAVDFLEDCINEKKCRDKAIHNYLLLLYSSPEDEVPLIRFLEKYPKMPFLDLRSALRICHSNGQFLACAMLYAYLELYEEAVRTSLSLDAERAKGYVRMAPRPLQKKLWLIIAKYMVEVQNNVKGVLSLMDDSSDLRIEDILPFFPDFVVVDDFKDQICNSLSKYNEEIKTLQSEMLECEQNANKIIDSIANLRHRCGYISADQCCDICGQPALKKRFLLFPCAHIFHTECIERNFNFYLSDDSIKELRKLNASSDKSDTIEKQKMEILSAECPFCGDCMINSLDKSLVTKENQSTEDWSL